ncbi:MAG: NAD(P)/FAD-dependent oxidoreductase [Baekduia sp.]
MSLTADHTPSTDADGGGGERHVRYAIIGTGFGGVGAAYRIQHDLGDRDFLIFERHPEAGGCWWANHYPGAQCDIPSDLYSLSFAPNPDWTRTYAPQGEIRDYLVSLTHKLGIRDRIRFNTTVTSASWDEDASLWQVETTAGTFTANYLIAAPGPLAEPTLPEIDGLGSFKGTVMHTAEWDDDIDLTGKRVAVVGTGASAIQAVPRIAEVALELTVFQRTPAWIMPHVDRDVKPIERAIYKRFPIVQRLRRAWAFSWRESMIPGFVWMPGLQRGLEALANKHRSDQVADPELRTHLTPSYRIGCKRVLPTNKWYPALQQDNVTLVPHAATGLTETGVTGADGIEREVDVIIFATGFHVADIPVGDHVTGIGGKTLTEVWDGSPQAHKGTTVTGFPNLFFLVGPNTGLGTNSIVYMIESQLNYLIGAIEATGRGRLTCNVRREAMDAWSDRMQQKIKGSVWVNGGCASWYVDANGKVTTLWPDFTFRFRQETKRFDAESYVMKPVPARVAAS